MLRVREGVLSDGFFQLTSVESRVANLVAQRLQRQGDCRAPGYHRVNTARTHVQQLLEKVGARNKAHLVALLLTLNGTDALVVEASRSVPEDARHLSAIPLKRLVAQGGHPY